MLGVNNYFALTSFSFLEVEEGSVSGDILFWRGLKLQEDVQRQNLVCLPLERMGKGISPYTCTWLPAFTACFLELPFLRELSKLLPCCCLQSI